jgi:hypothetical protein
MSEPIIPPKPPVPVVEPIPAQMQEPETPAQRAAAKAAGEPDLTPVYYEALDPDSGAVIWTSLVSRDIYDQIIANGNLTVREVAGMPPLAPPGPVPPIFTPDPPAGAQAQAKAQAAPVPPSDHIKRKLF